MKICKHCVISGRVQGVFYRQGTFKQATALGVTGWVRNLQNGDVECVLCGEDDAVNAICEWLKQGPPAAHVTNVAITDLPLEEFTAFTIKR